MAAILAHEMRGGAATDPRRASPANPKDGNREPALAGLVAKWLIAWLPVFPRKDWRDWINAVHLGTKIVLDLGHGREQFREANGDRVKVGFWNIDTDQFAHRSHAHAIEFHG
jgi:hypothetical protein